MSRDLTTGPDDLQELARRGRWLLQTAIAEVALRERSRCRSRQRPHLRFAIRRAPTRHMLCMTPWSPKPWPVVTRLTLTPVAHPVVRA